MKTLVIIGVVLAVLTLYFVVNAERSILVKKGSEVFPAGTDIAKFILKKTKDLISQNDITNTSFPAIVETIKAGATKFIPEVFDKITGLVKKPIENKISDLFCPGK